jgi:hypothetical protein
LFKKTLAKLSVVLFLAAFLVPAGRLYAQSSDQTIVTGADPEPKAVGGDSTDAMSLELEVAMQMALQVS